MNKIVSVVQSIFADTKKLPFLIPPLGALLCVLIYRADPDALILQKWFLEIIALVLMGSAFSVAVFRVRIESNPLMKIMLAWSFAFFCREIHFAGTSTGVYIAAVLIAVWAWSWRERLAEPFRIGDFKTWVLTTGWAYFLTIIIQRRVFKHLPGMPDGFYILENDMHVEAEEFTEVIAHFCLLITCCCGFSSRFLRKK